MTREEARKLLSGYATGSLTESEQKLLFSAALDDQELFDELADEQSLKELIELPGARQRLLEALEPPRRQRAWWAQPWPWVAAATASLIALAVLFEQRTPETPVEIAAVETAPAVQAIQVPAAPTGDTAPQAKAAAQSAQRAAEAFDAIAPVAEKAVTQFTETQTLADATAASAETRALPASPVPPPAQNETPRLRAESSTPAVPPAKPVAAAQAFLAAGDSRRVAGEDVLTYEVQGTGTLRIVPARAGVLEVMAGPLALFRSNPVVANTPIELSIPTDAQQLRIDFAEAADAPAVTATQRDETSGTLALPAGISPRIAVTIPARP